MEQNDHATNSKLLNHKVFPKWQSRWRREGAMLPLALGLLAVLIIPQVQAAGIGDNQEGLGSRHMVCPSVHDMIPCMCKVMSKGLNIVCDNTDERHFQNALDVLKQNTFTSTIYWMKIRTSNIQRIKDYIFLGLNVRHLNIIRSNVSVVEGASLSALGSSLTDLDLSNNNIHAIPTHAFTMLKSLTFLNLNYNKITAIYENAFDGLIVLQRLSLYQNQIKRIHDNAFQGIGRKLARLNLGKNKLHEIPTDTFHPLSNLQVLDLNENYIKYLPDSAFQGLHKLDMLRLEHNEITSIQDNVFKDLTMLNSLNMEHNRIKNISEMSFAGMENTLGWLELGSNQLDHIPSHALRPLHNLRQLDLDSNKISTIHEDTFRGYGDTLKFLQLDKNQIRNISPLAFINLHSLEWLKLSHNDLATLTEDTVQPVLDTLTQIDISSNPLICNCEIYWLFNWLNDPNNAENVQANNDHKCITLDQKTHTIKMLTEGDFDCERANGFRRDLSSLNENNTAALDDESRDENVEESDTEDIPGSPEPNATQSAAIESVSLQPFRPDEGAATSLNSEPPKKKRKPIFETAAISKLREIAELTNHDCEDQYSDFGNHVASQLRELPLVTFIELQEKIQSLITKERLSILQNAQPSPHMHPSTGTSPLPVPVTEDPVEGSSAEDVV